MSPMIINAMKQPLIARQVIRAKQLPFTTLPIADWQQAAHEPAATPTVLKPKMQQDNPVRSIKAPITIPTIISININIFFSIYIKL